MLKTINKRIPEDISIGKNLRPKIESKANAKKRAS